MIIHSNNCEGMNLLKCTAVCCSMEPAIYRGRGDGWLRILSTNTATLAGLEPFLSWKYLHRWCLWKPESRHYLRLYDQDRTVPIILENDWIPVITSLYFFFFGFFCTPFNIKSRASISLIIFFFAFLGRSCCILSSVFRLVFSFTDLVLKWI